MNVTYNKEIIDEKCTQAYTVKIWKNNLSFGELTFFMSDKKPIKKTIIPAPKKDISNDSVLMFGNLICQK